MLLSFSLMWTESLRSDRSVPEAMVQPISRTFGSWSLSIFFRSSPVHVLSTRGTNRIEFDQGAEGSPNLKQSISFLKILYRILREIELKFDGQLSRCDCLCYLPCSKAPRENPGEGCWPLLTTLFIYPLFAWLVSYKSSLLLFLFDFVLYVLILFRRSPSVRNTIGERDTNADAGQDSRGGERLSAFVNTLIWSTDIKIYEAPDGNIPVEKWGAELGCRRQTVIPRTSSTFESATRDLKGELFPAIARVRPALSNLNRCLQELEISTTHKIFATDLTTRANEHESPQSDNNTVLDPCLQTTIVMVIWKVRQSSSPVRTMDAKMPRVLK